MAMTTMMAMTPAGDDPAGAAVAAALAGDHRIVDDSAR